MINFIKKIIIFCIYLPFYLIFLIHSKFLKISNPGTKIIYPRDFGFGDYLFFCSRLISKLNKKIKIYCFSKTQYEIASFYFEDRVILKQLILLPKFLSESHFGYAFLRRYNKFNPTIIFSEYNKKEELSRHYMGNKKIIDFLKKRIFNNIQLIF